MGLNSVKTSRKFLQVHNNYYGQRSSTTIRYWRQHQKGACVHKAYSSFHHNPGIEQFDTTQKLLVILKILLTIFNVYFVSTVLRLAVTLKISVHSSDVYLNRSVNIPFGRGGALLSVFLSASFSRRTNSKHFRYET